MSTKQKILIIVSNILLIVLIIFIANFYVIYKETKSFNSYVDFMKRDISEQDTYNQLISSNEFRRTENINSKKKPLLIFGCSYAEGSGLEENQTISYKLGKLTHRPVINRARAGFGVQHMYYQLSNEDFYKIVNKPEYIIYVYFEGHPLRVSTPVTVSYNNCYTVFYKKTKNGLVKKRRTFLNDKIVFQHYLRNHFTWNFLTRYNGYNLWEESRILDYFYESKKEVEKHWGKDVKFVILFYANMHDELMKELEENGFIAITKNDFKINVEERQYKISDTDNHPSEKAWDAIVPVIVKKLKL